MKNPSLKIGGGFDLSRSFNSHLQAYSKGFGVRIGYGLLHNNGIETDNTKITRAISLFTNIAMFAMISEESFDPIYLGFGITFLDEEATGQMIRETGTIRGYNFTLGYQFFALRPWIDIDLGSHIELGYTKWNYDDSILLNSETDKRYNFSNFHLSLGMSYYFH